MPIVVRVIQKTCPCGNFLGIRQEEFESLVEKGMEQYMAAKTLGFKRTCCINNILNAPLFYINNRNEGVFIDETKDEYGQNKLVPSKKEFFSIDGELILPKKEVPKLEGFIPNIPLVKLKKPNGEGFLGFLGNKEKPFSLFSK